MKIVQLVGIDRVITTVLGAIAQYGTIGSDACCHECVPAAAGCKIVPRLTRQCNRAQQHVRVRRLVACSNDDLRTGFEISAMRINNRLRITRDDRSRPERIIDIAALCFELGRETAVNDHWRARLE